METNQHPSPDPVEQTAKTQKKPRTGLWLIFGAASALRGLLVVGIVPRLQRQSELNAAGETAWTSVPTVNVLLPQRSPASNNLLLPGSIQAIQETTIYARTDGYLKRRSVDIGDRVQAGQLIAEIDSPETDQQTVTSDQWPVSSDWQLTTDNWQLITDNW